MSIYERQKPTTLPPTSRGYVNNINCCSHCQSGIDKSDKVCTRCGAPNENYEQVIKKKEETFGEAIRQIESMECAPRLFTDCVRFDHLGFTTIGKAKSKNDITIIDESGSVYDIDAYLPDKNYDKIGCWQLKNKLASVIYSQ